jgi:hypothetical protein
MLEKACILCSEYEFRLSSQSLLRSFRLMESFLVILHATRTLHTGRSCHVSETLC